MIPEAQVQGSRVAVRIGEILIQLPLKWTLKWTFEFTPTTDCELTTISEPDRILRGERKKNYHTSNQKG